MLLSVIRYIRGYVRLRVEGYSAERFLNACSHRGIYIWDLKPVRGAYEMYMFVSDFRKLRPIIRKTGTRTVIVRRCGLPFFLHRYRKRKLFLGGIFLCIAMIYILSLFIWDIDIEGNRTRTDETLLSFLKSMDVEHGMKKSKVDCVRIVKDIRKEYEDIIWVSASIEGTRLLIQVKENEDSIQVSDTEEEEEPFDLVADTDCVITEIITRSGVPQVKAGDQVKKGDILVSGRVPVNNDAGEVSGYQYHTSDADIWGKTVIAYQEEMPLTYIEKKETGTEKEELFLKVGSYYFGLGSRRNNYKNFIQYSREKQWKIGEEFYLPIGTGSRITRPYTPKEKKYTEKEIQEMLSARLDRYFETLENDGAEILSNDVKIYMEADKAVAKGSLTVVAPVASKAPTEIIEVPKEEAKDGENTGEN